MHSEIRAFYEYNPLDEIYAAVPDSVISRYRGTLPDFLLEIWANDGLSTHKDGFFRLVNPDDYHQLINSFILSDQQLQVVLSTAFGGMIFYDPDNASPTAQGKHYSFFCPVFLQRTPLSNDLDAIMKGWLTTEEIYVPLMLYNLYTLARKRLPRPTANECYGFVPAIALGGDLDAGQISLYKLKLHLDFLAQLDSAPPHW